MSKTDSGVDLTGIFREIAHSLTGIKDYTDGRLRERAALNKMGQRAAAPADVRLIGSGAVPASQILVISLASPAPSPDEGHVWILRNWSMGRGDAQLGTGLTGNAYLLVRPSQPGGALGGGGQLDWNGVKDSMTLSALGPCKQYSSRQIVCKSNEYVWVVITGGTNGQVAFAQIDVEDVQESAAKQAFEI